jgi:hypothetical protein
MFYNAIILYGSSFWETAATQNCGHPQGFCKQSIFSSCDKNHISHVMCHKVTCLLSFWQGLLSVTGRPVLPDRMALPVRLPPTIPPTFFPPTFSPTLLPSLSSSRYEKWTYKSPIIQPLSRCGNKRKQETHTILSNPSQLTQNTSPHLGLRV